ncbi:IgGFc-binding protein [Nannocystis pusilla]|uniref:IgGFc-binding protein n=1 Tax=Nannocystis pusilla TaxID=889268 RepID=A0A9X3ETB1_9BACT|nr:IgGFc-binding protein [Nannocystis pusilla]MCY1009872.1 IgGFc-binding protein [Nannocystis pusilla]
MTHRLCMNACTSAALAASLLAACGDNGGSSATNVATMSAGTTTAATDPGTTAASNTDTPTTNPPTEGTGTQGMTETGTTQGPTSTGPGTTDNPVTSTTGPDTTTTTTPGTTTVDTTTTQGTTTVDTTTTTGDSTTGEDPFFGEIPETCEQAELSKSTVGCAFYALDMDSHDSAETGQFAVAVANVQKDQQATVTIERKQGGVWNMIAGPTPINALGLQTFNLPDQHTDDSQLAPGFAYRVKSTVPVIAYQFNPVDGSASYLSDASMLYPVTGLDSINHVIAWTSMMDNTNTFQHSYASAVAVMDNTKIKVTPSTTTAAGSGVPAGQPGVPFEITLNEGDVLSVAVQSLGTSMTGTIFESAKETPFMLFAGQECALIPADVCCCDHMEEQISGVRLWGKHFIGARTAVRSVNAPEPSLWQIYGAEDGTTVTLNADAQVTGLPANPIILDKGEVVEFYAGGPMGEPGDFEITADKPIGVMNYMTGAENLPDQFFSIGDPAAVQIPSVEQFLPRYVILVPATWINDVGVFTRQAGATVTIDGVPIPDSQWNPVADSDYEVARVPLGDGVHVLEGGEVPFSVIVVGWDQHDSYSYLGGTGTKIVNPTPM